MNFKILILFLICAVSNISAETISKGDKMMKSFDFADAIVFYKKELEGGANGNSALGKIATCYRLMNNYAAAEPWLEKCVESNIDRQKNMFYLAQAYRINQKYELAEATFKQHSTEFNDTTSARMAMSIDKVVKNSNKSTKKIYLMPFNSPQSDFAPFYSKDKLYFASNRIVQDEEGRIDYWTKLDFLQLYTVNNAKNSMNVNAIAQKYNDGNTINAKYHEGPISIHPVTRDLYFSRSNYIHSKATKSKDDAVKLKIYRVGFNKATSKWDGAIENPLEFNNDQYSVAHPTFNADGTMMYFVSDMPGGYGGSDIWMAPITDGKTIGKPVNLGAEVNTPHNELFPTMRTDDILIYSTDGMYGFGAQDFYYTFVKKDGTWKKPMNLGAPFNTNMDDFAMTFTNDSTEGYLTSNRANGRGDDDIYSFRFNPNLTKDNVQPAPPVVAVVTPDPVDPDPVKVVPTPDPTPTPVKVTPTPPKPTDPLKDLIEPTGPIVEVKVIDKNTKEVISTAKVELCYVKHLTGNDGMSSYTADNAYGRTCMLRAAKSDGPIKYMPHEEMVRVVPKEGEKNVLLIVELEPLEIGKEVAIKNILYDLDKYFIRPDAAGELSKTLMVMREYPNMVIEMGSHTDCRMSYEYNMKLSQNRAKAALEWLVSNGVSASRMTHKGYGETRLTNNCPCEGTKPVSVVGLRAFRIEEDKQCIECSKDMHQANRRTTFKIISF